MGICHLQLRQDNFFIKLPGMFVVEPPSSSAMAASSSFVAASQPLSLFLLPPGLMFSTKSSKFPHPRGTAPQKDVILGPRLSFRSYRARSSPLSPGQAASSAAVPPRTRFRPPAPHPTNTDVRGARRRPPAHRRASRVRTAVGPSARGHRVRRGTPGTHAFVPVLVGRI